MFEYYEVRFKFTPAPLHYCITLYMLFNVVGHKIDGTYESWKYIEGAVFPTPWGKTVFSVLFK